MTTGGAGTRRNPADTPNLAEQAYRQIHRMIARCEPEALQAAVARLYDLDERAFASVLGTFPLVAAREKTAALAAFRAAKNGI